jgi:hypothetical protein
MMIKDHKLPGHHMQPMASTSQPPPTTTDASDSTFLHCAASASPTPGACTKPTAKSQLPRNMTSPLQRQQTSSRYLGVRTKISCRKNQAHMSHPGTHHDHGRTTNRPTNSGCTNSEGGCTSTMSKAPPPSAHLVTFWQEKKVPPLQTQRHNLSNNYTEMECRNDGNFLIARQISDALRTKIARGLITPWRSGVPF